jgi:hypothetical protein
VCQRLRFRPNGSLYRAGGRLHYAQPRLNAGVRSYHLVAVDETPELRTTLEHAAAGAHLGDLAAPLVSAEISPDEASEFVEELVTSQLLVSELGPDVTGEGAIQGLIAVFNSSLRGCAGCDWSICIDPLPGSRFDQPDAGARNRLRKNQRQA